VAVTRGAGDPVAGSSGVIPWPADKARSGHQQPVADGIAGRLLAGDLGFAVLFAADLVAIGRREHLRGFVGARGGVRGVHVAGRDIGPMLGVLVQRGKRAADQAGLPRHLNHGVPALIGQRGVRLWVASICGNQDRADGDRPAAAAGQAGHVMTTSHALASKFASQLPRSAKHQQFHAVQSTKRHPR
jgi:hypothetical protein